MLYNYVPKGVCCKSIDFGIEDGCLTNVKFCGGCSGNGKSIAKLVEGMDVILAMKKLRGITCGNKNTSCADQLVKAIENVEI